MAELAAALARMLEFVAAALPAAFLGGGAAAGVDLARLAETAAYVVMQVAGPGVGRECAGADARLPQGRALGMG
jgi:hypothetical protein